ncbi:hypothetical protein DSO57_1013385 [Entomophthora muscae]|uniref:Uncharacterized protein n=1 Tax=Entomophthora muscae TaxID=34485 RepID=A0ACC2S7R4_9FUNG|nr:hypothetical protein DSO57_1013385 [Entomophthora muscae]
MNHLIFSAVLTACLGIGGHQYNHQHGPFNKSPGKYVYKEPAQLKSSEQYSWPTLVLPHSTQSMMTVYPIMTALTRFQVANLAPAAVAQEPASILCQPSTTQLVASQAPLPIPQKIRIPHKLQPIRKVS